MSFSKAKKALPLVLLTLTINIAMVIFTLYEHDRFQPARRAWRTRVNSTRYLWCINHYGPNNQLRDLIKCCVLARLSNYTIVLPPLFPHYGRRNTSRVQWFEHFYDIERLGKTVDLITMDQFVTRAKTSESTLSVDCYIREVAKVSSRAWYAMNTLHAIHTHYKLRIDFRQHVNLSERFSTNELIRASHRCSSVLLHVHYTTLQPMFLHPNEHIRSIFESLHRTPLVQRLAAQLSKLGAPTEKPTTLAAVHMRLGDYNVMNLSAYIAQITYLLQNGVNFTHLHIMCPYLNASDVKQLKASLPLRFTTSQDLLDHGRLLLDDYFFDVLEQEIAYQAPIFLASPWSTYSATVLMQKVLHNRGTTYVLSKNPRRPPVLVTNKTVQYFP